MQTWQMPDAKGRLSEVVKPAETEGPQSSILHDCSMAVAVAVAVAVDLSHAAFKRLSGRHATVVACMRAWPMDGLDDALVFERDTNQTRDLPL